MIERIKAWVRFFLVDRYSLVKYPTVKIKGKYFIETPSGLQCAYCLYMQDVNRYVENSLKDPNGRLIGYWLHNIDEQHTENCKQKT